MGQLKSYFVLHYKKRVLDTEQALKNVAAKDSMPVVDCSYDGFRLSI
jgi:hypothetical protein